MALPSKEKSRIKMCAYTQAEALRMGNCIVWYNYPERNKQPNREIIKGMLQRLEKYYLFSSVKVVQFYDVQSGNLIEEYKRKL